MKRFLKKLSVVAVAAIMVVSLSLGLFAGCSRNYNLSVFVFSSATDQATNQTLIDAWAANYAEENNLEPFEVELTYESDTTNYFNRVSSLLSSGDLQDVFYVSPKQVRSYAVAGVTLDLTDYVDWSKYPVNEIYSDALKLYATDGETVGEEVTYTDGAFKTADGTEMGIYALPKDFSSFGLAYNKNFFTTALRNAYTTNQADGVYYANADGTADKTRPANYVNIGQTVVYFPYNFFNYDSYDAALAANDPIAVLSNRNGGYAVTILGWPGDTYDTGIEDNSATIYDESLGYVTYTYSEYSAMTYAVAYYVHSQRDAGTNKYTDTNLEWLNDTTAYGTTNYVYGNDQYEGPLYLTAWLLGNDANIINGEYNSVDASQTWDYDTQQYVASNATANTGDWAGTYSFPEGTDAYGINSLEFVEAYAAFLAYGSDWNNLSYYSGNSSETVDTRGGWPCFSAGRQIFYGLGTWDLQTLNSTATTKLQVGIMPEPVSEDFSPYARVKNARYKSQVYDADSSGALTSASLNVYTNGAIDSSSANYTAWKAFQDARQDQWFARLDSVGYGVNADVLDRYKGDQAWKVDAMCDLCAFLSCSEEVQSAFTYSGSQLSSLTTQCEDYVYYQTAGTDGAFANMITTDGVSQGNLTVSQAELTMANAWLTSNRSDWVIDAADTTISGEEVWHFAVAAANLLYGNRRTAGTGAAWIESNFPSLEPYLNPYFSITRASQMDGVAYAYKILNMVGFNYAERNLQVRMASGINGAADSCTFTYSSTWSDTTFSTSYKGNALIAYNVDKDPGAASESVMKYDNSVFTPANLVTIATGNANGTGWTGNYYTPYAYCQSIVQAVQNDLRVNSLIAEQNYINANR